MKKIFILNFILLFCILPSFSYEMEIQVDLTMGNYFNNFYPANFNPDKPDSQPVFFNVTITQTGNTTINFYQIYMKLSWDENDAEVWLTPDDFSLPKFLTNRHIINNDPENFNLSVDSSYDNFLDAIEDYILETGRLPDGSYNFTFQLLDLEREPISNQVFKSIIIKSPISISLITPGYPLGSFGPMNVLNQYPEFIWFSNLTDYTFDLYHIDEEVESAEEIELLDKYFSTTINSNSLVYPGNAASLEDGEIYAWQVSAPLLSPGSTEIYKSVFYTFQIDMEEEEDEVEEVIVINFLNQLNTDDITVLQNLLNNGYNISTITWQGQEISVDELMNILNQIANGELELKE